MGEDNYSFRKKRTNTTMSLNPFVQVLAKAYLLWFVQLSNASQTGRPRKDGTKPYYYRCNNKSWDKSKAAIDECGTAWMPVMRATGGHQS